MIYRIQLYTDQLSGKWTWEDVWCYKDGHFDVGETSWVRSANAISSLTFDAYPSNQCYGLLGVNSRVRILNAEGWADTGDYYGFKTEFCGRVIEVTPQMDEDGTVYKNVVCEDALGFLQDSVLYFDSNKAWFDGKSDSYPVDIDGDGVRSIGAEDLVRLIVGQHNSTVSANDSMGEKSWKKLYVGYLDLTHDDGTQLEVDLDPQYEKTGYELLADVADELGAQFSVTYDEGGNKPCVNVGLQLGDDNVGEFAVGDNLAQSALETSIAATATRLFPWGDEYSKLKETKPKGTDVKGRLKGTDWETGGSYYMARFNVEGGLKAHITVGRRNKDYGMVVFASKALTKANADKKDVVVRKYTTKASSTGDNIDKWYPVPEDAKYCYVYGPTTSGSKVVLYSEYTATDGTDTWAVNDKYRVDLAFWLKYLSDKDKKAALKKWKLELGSVTDKSDDKLYYLAANEDKYGVIEGAFEVDKCHLKTDKITQASTKITSVTDLVTVGKSKTAKWRRKRARIFFRAACKQASKLCNEALTVSAKVVDMRAGRYERYPELHLFDTWHLYNDKCGIDVDAQLTRISCDLREPWNAEVEFGDKVTRASGIGGGSGSGLASGDMGDTPAETDGDDESDSYATMMGEATEKAAKEAVEKADELDQESYQIKVDAWAAGELASQAEGKVSPITTAMRGLLSEAEKQAETLTGVVERQEKTISLSNDLASAVASYAYETEKSVVRFKQTYSATLDAWASEEPEVQREIAEAYALLYGGTLAGSGTKDDPYRVVDASGSETGPDNVMADSAQGHLNAAKAEQVTASQTKAEMDAKLSEAHGNLTATQKAKASAQSTYDKAKAAYEKAKKDKKATKKAMDKAHRTYLAAKSALSSATASVEEADKRCAEATDNYNDAVSELAKAEAKVEHAQSEVDVAMNGIHEKYSSVIEQTAKSIKQTVSEVTALGSKVTSLEVRADGVTTTISEVSKKADDAQDTADNAAAKANETTTIIRQYSDGVLVGKTTNTVGSLVNAKGSFDVVNVAWAEVSGTYKPTVGSTIISMYSGHSDDDGDYCGITSPGKGELQFFEDETHITNDLTVEGDIFSYTDIRSTNGDITCDDYLSPGHYGGGVFANGVGIMRGNGGNNHGLWSTLDGNWIIYRNSDGDTYSPKDLVTGGELRSTGAGTSTSTANCRLTTGSPKGTVRFAASSSKRYKHDIEDINADYLSPELLYDLPVRQFIFNDGYLVEGDDRDGFYVPGLIAEEVAEHYPMAADLGEEEGTFENWNEKMIVPPMLKLIQDQKKQIDALTSRVEELERSVLAAPQDAESDAR